jgi:hypothetical protein
MESAPIAIPTASVTAAVSNGLMKFPLRQQAAFDGITPRFDGGGKHVENERFETEMAIMTIDDKMPVR